MNEDTPRTRQGPRESIGGVHSVASTRRGAPTPSRGSQPMVRVEVLNPRGFFGGGEYKLGRTQEWKWIGSARRGSELLSALISDAAKARPGGASIRTEVMA